MAQPEPITQRYCGRTAAASRSAPTVAILFAILAIAALTEVVAGLAVRPANAPRVARWERAMQIGDEARERGDVPAARHAYLATLFRARGDRSLAGVIDAAERFRALGDRGVAEQALGMAASLGGADRDDETRRRLQALRDQLRASSAPPLTVRAPR